MTSFYSTKPGERRNYLSGPETRELLRQRDGCDCWICGKPVQEGLPQGHPWSATIDHYHEKSRGGGNSIDNLQLAHRFCNMARSNNLIEITPGLCLLLTMVESMVEHGR